MNKLFLVVCLFLLGTFAQAESFFKEYKTNVLEANEKQIVIADSSEFIVGASGVVTHKFDAKSTTIIARVDVISKNGTKAVLRLEKFEMLSQGAFPDTGIKPVVGDEVTINYLYDRSAGFFMSKKFLRILIYLFYDIDLSDIITVRKMKVKNVRDLFVYLTIVVLR